MRYLSASVGFDSSVLAVGVADRHPYEETFIIQEGEARFTVAEKTIEAVAGRSSWSRRGRPTGS
jgi:quercetin dioxygenase-like cupin family protein